MTLREEIKHTERQISALEDEIEGRIEEITAAAEKLIQHRHELAEKINAFELLLDKLPLYMPQKGN